jgi:hypothetical protein
MIVASFINKNWYNRVYLCYEDTLPKALLNNGLPIKPEDPIISILLKTYL